MATRQSQRMREHLNSNSAPPNNTGQDDAVPPVPPNLRRSVRRLEAESSSEGNDNDPVANATTTTVLPQEPQQSK